MDHRSESRERAGFHGIVHLDADRPSLPCAVRDLSAGGARLSFLEPTEVPDRFRLVLTASDETCRAVVRWRRGLEIGVAFEAREGNLDIAWAEPEAADR